MKVTILLHSQKDLQSAIATDANGNNILIDVTGGHFDQGVRPMQLLLHALASCSIVDVLHILQKQKQEVKEFHVVVEGEREQDVVPALWKKIDLKFNLVGNVEQHKAERAIELSVNKYCSVAETLRRAGAEIGWTVEVESLKFEV